MEENLDVADKMEGIPIVTLRDLVVFPKTTVYFEVGRENTVKALKEAMNGRQLVFTVTQKDPAVETPGMDDLFETGTLAEVKQIVNMPGKVIRVVISGRERKIHHIHLKLLQWYVGLKIYSRYMQMPMAGLTQNLLMKY